MVKSPKMKGLKFANASAPSWLNEAAMEATAIPSVRSNGKNDVKNVRSDAKNDVKIAEKSDARNDGKSVVRIAANNGTQMLMHSDVSNCVSGSRFGVPSQVHSGGFLVGRHI